MMKAEQLVEGARVHLLDTHRDFRGTIHLPDGDGKIWVHWDDGDRTFASAHHWTEQLTLISYASVDPFDNIAPDIPNTTKETNPKDAVGCTKPPTHLIPTPVLYEVGNALLEGACKYGAYNWRVAGVRASIYDSACGRHLSAWREGEDLDPDSGIHHISKAIAGLMVIRDAMMQGKFNDDRPPKAKAGWMAEAQKQTDAILARYPNPKAPNTEL